MPFTQVEDIEFQSHVPKGELHNPISAIYNGIRSSQEWPSQYEGYMVGPHCNRLCFKYDKIHYVVEFVHLY